MKDIDFCRNLKKLREAAQLTQVQLEKRAGFPETLISHYENGLRKPGLDNIKALCKGLKCTASELLGV